MSGPNVKFIELSSHADDYTISFAIQSQEPVGTYTVISQAIEYRLGQIVEENELKVIGLCVKIDCFDFRTYRQSHVEMDTLCQTESVSSVDAYLYDQDNKLLAKGSGTLQFEKTSRVPSY
jgi:hypothetical protein